MTEEKLRSLWPADVPLVFEQPEDRYAAMRRCECLLAASGTATLEAALARELAEELSLSIRHPRLWRTVEHDYPLRSVRVHFFHITDYSGEPIANERQAFLWVTPQEARDLPFLEADRPLLPLLKRP